MNAINYFNDFEDDLPVVFLLSAFVGNPNIIMQGKLFQRCTHLLYCSVLSMGGNISTRRMSKPDMGFIVHIKNR